MEAIQKGRNAFGQNAIMDWSKMPEFDPLEAMEQEGAWAKSELFLAKRLLKLLKETTAYRDSVINKNPPKVLEDEEEDLGKKVDEAVEEEEKVSKEAKAQAKKEAEAEEEEEEEEHNSETDSLLWRTDEQATKHAQQQVCPLLLHMDKKSLKESALMSFLGSSK
jgi:ABC-type Zn2+ transport system substrate-binding protein/surface adhesin